LDSASAGYSQKKKGVKKSFTPDNQPLGIELVKQVGSDGISVA